jgi:tetratricopeptide (TPR) repeat protein
VPERVAGYDTEVRELLRALLDDDSFPRAGRLLAAGPVLLTPAADRILDELAVDASAPYRPAAIDQLRAFLQRCGRDGLPAVFPAGHAEIDPTMVAVIRSDMDAGNAAEEAYARTGDPTALHAASEAWLRVVRAPALRAAYPGLRAALDNDAGATLLNRYLELGDPDDLVTAIQLFNSAVALTPRRSTNWARRHGNLAWAMREAYQRTDNPETLDAAIDVAREAARATDSTPGPASGAALLPLAQLLRDRHRRTGDPGDLIAAIEVAERACALADSGPARATLGDLLMQRFEDGGGDDDLPRAVALLSGAAEATPVGDPQRPRRLVDLSIGLLARHRVSGEPADVTEAVRLCAEAVDAIPPTSPDRPACLAQWANALYLRYEATGQFDDLETAATAVTAAIDTAADTDAAVPGWRVHLGTLYQTRWARSDDVRDLDRAIELFQSVVDGPAQSADRYAALNNLGNALRGRGRLRADLDDLDRAVDRLREALALTRQGTTRHSTTGTNLALALRDRYLVAGRPDGAVARRADLNEALDLLGRCVAAGAQDEPDHPRRLFALARTARDRADSLAGRQDPTADADRTLAVTSYYRGGRHGVLADPESTLMATLEWGHWATTRRAWPEAADAYGTAVAALTTLLRRQLVRGHQEEWLRTAGALAAPAAYATAAAGRAVDAVVAIERTRAVILSEVLDRHRADLDMLAAASPRLAERYVAATVRLASGQAAASPWWPLTES